MRRTRSISKSVGRRPAVPLFWPAAMAVLLSAVPGSASAETEVRGLPDAMYLRAENAPVGEVLAAISAEFKLRYPPRSNLDRTVTGVYSGPLRDVLTRILDGANYVIKYSGDDIEIKVLSSPSTVDRLHSSSAVTVNQNAIASAKTVATPESMPSPIAPLVPK